MFLATTALENFWDKNQKIVFLGEWCKLYHKKEEWQKYEADTIEYHWDDRQKLASDYHYLMQIHESVLDALTGVLNSYHNEKHSKRYWRIIIGPWLLFFIEILFDRYWCLKNASKKHTHLNTFTTTAHFVPMDCIDYHYWYLTDEYNYYLYSSILRAVNLNIKTKNAEGLAFVKIPSKNKLDWKQYLINNPITQTIVLKMQSLFNSICLYDSYLSNNDLLDIHVKLKHVPFFGSAPNVVHEMKQKPLSAIRNAQFMNHGEDEFSNLVSTVLLKHMPIIYIENYKEALKKSLQIYPKNPKMIFTSNALWMNDGFKIWCADRVEKKHSLLIAGQHGGGYGSFLFNCDEEHEKAVSDRFVTWGWDEKNEKVMPFFKIKNTKKAKKFRYTEDGKITIISASLPRWSYWLYSIPISSQTLDYFSTLVSLFKNIDTTLLNTRMIYRLYYDYGWKEKNRLQDIFPKLKIEEMSVPYLNSLYESSLCVCTYNATTFLETFSLNLPTVMFWDPKYWELRNDAIPYYNKLVEAGILFHSAKQCGLAINTIAQAPMEWWSSTKVQDAKNEFCNRFARNTEGLSNEFVKLVRDCQQTSRAINRA